MKLCAIVLDYRGAAKTEACLRSLAGQEIDTVVLVDNSDDAAASAELAGTVERLREAGVDYRLHAFKPDTNLGFARGVNFALSQPVAGHCEAILLLNNDARMAPGAVQRMATAFVAEQADAAVPAIVDDGGKPQPQLYYQRFFGFLTTRMLPGSYPYPSGCCILLKRDLAPSGKLLDEDFFMYGEDTLLGWQLMRKKKKTLHVPQATVHHSGQDARLPDSLFYEYHIARAHLLLATKTVRSAAEIPLLVCTKIAGLLLRAVRRCARYRSLLPLRGLFMAWRRIEIRKT